jgi:two-component system, NtrC family, sensor histidine kinase HydH
MACSLMVKCLQTFPVIVGKMKEDTNHTHILRLSLLMAFVVGISLLHYLTPLNLPMLHDIYQRLYYIPIILAAFWFGLKGGIVCAVAVSIVYAPHILFQWGGHLAMEMEKYLEIVLYNVVGGVTGFLCQREEARRMELERTALGLEESYGKLQAQSEMIMEMEGELRRAERLSAIGELGAVLAHEIRNPLASIKGTAEILKDDLRPGDRKYEFLEILVKESERLNRVVEDFLRMARPQPMNMGDCDVIEELGNVITLVSAEARKGDVRLEFETTRLPLVEGDPEKLRQAFLNIILNGLQATSPGGSVTISGTCEGGGDGGPARICLSFSDTGSGMSGETLERIFEPFYTSREEGTGLGLAITRKIIEGHGGRIEVKSRPGEGSEFLVRLPVKRGGGS